VPGCLGNRLAIVPGFFYSDQHPLPCYRPTPSDTGAWDMLRQQPESPQNADGPISLATLFDPVSQAVAAGSPDAETCSESSSQCDDAESDVSCTEDGDDGEAEHAAADGMSLSDGSYCSASEDGGEGDSGEDGSAMPANAAQRHHPDPSPSTSADAATSSLIPDRLPMLEMIIVHHKMERHWGKWPIRCILPYDLGLLVHLYLGPYGRAVLDTARDSNLLFPDLLTGQVMCDTSLSVLWRRLQQYFDAPWAHFPPNKFRHIHILKKVESVVQTAARAGVELRGDAALMTNTPDAVWQRSYLKGKAFSTLAPAALTDIAQWKVSEWRALRAAEVAAGQAAGPSVPASVLTAAPSGLLPVGPSSRAQAHASLHAEQRALAAKHPLAQRAMDLPVGKRLRPAELAAGQATCPSVPAPSGLLPADQPAKAIEVIEILDD
jgi:hypothetical protein